LKITKEAQEEHQIKLIVELEPELMENAKRRAAKHIAKNIKIPGFRPGKAPYHVIVRYAGEGAVTEKGMELLVQDIYPKLIEDAEIEPYGPGSLENIVSLEPPTLEFLIPLEAEVVLGDYKSIEKTYSPEPVQAEDIDQVLKNLQEQHATLVPADRPALEGDIATVNLVGDRFLTDEEELTEENESGGEILFPSRSLQMLIQPDDEEDDWPYPGFTTNLIGMNIGESKQINHKYPDDYGSESLQGTEVRFEFTIEDLKARILPELNNDFADTVGEYETLEDLQKAIRESLEEQRSSSYMEEYDETILTELINISEIKYPPQMLDKQIDNMIDNLTFNLEQQKLDLDLYLKMRNVTLEELRAETIPIAETRLKRTLALMELAKLEDIQIDPEELEREIDQTILAIRESQEPSRKAETITRDDRLNIATNLMASMLTNLAMERFRDIAKGTSGENITTDINNEDSSSKLKAGDKEVQSEDSETSDEISDKSSAEISIVEEESDTKESVDD